MNGRLSPSALYCGRQFKRDVQKELKESDIFLCLFGSLRIIDLSFVKGLIRVQPDLMRPLCQGFSDNSSLSEQINSTFQVARRRAQLPRNNIKRRSACPKDKKGQITLSGHFARAIEQRTDFWRPGNVGLELDGGRVTSKQSNRLSHPNRTFHRGTATTSEDGVHPELRRQKNEQHRTSAVGAPAQRAVFGTALCGSDRPGARGILPHRRLDTGYVPAKDLLGLRKQEILLLGTVRAAMFELEQCHAHL